MRWWIIPISSFLCAAQMVLAISAENTRDVILTPTQISVLAFAVLVALVLVVNPAWRMLRLSRWIVPLTRGELTCLFAAMLITSGISTFGLAAHLVPLIGAPWNPEWNTPQRGWETSILPRLNQQLYITDVRELRQFREGVRQMPPPPADADWSQWERYYRRGHEAGLPIAGLGTAPLASDWPTRQAVLKARYDAGERGVVLLTRPADSAGWGRWGPYYLAVARSIQWSAWLGPLFYWLIFIAALYAMFYSLTYVLLGFWAGREKLMFPLAKLPETLLPDEQGRMPAVLRDWGFWAAFALSFFVLSWNQMQAAQWLGGLSAIPLGMTGADTAALLTGTIWEGLTGGVSPVAFMIVFTAIGITFLLPLEVSFSTWFYYLVGAGMILLAVWMGYGQTRADFPSGLLRGNNMVTAQGAGALLLFSLICLWRCLIDLRQQAADRPAAQKLMLAMPVLGLIASMIAITGWIAWSGVEWYWGLLLASFLVLLTTGLMRIVAEGGIFVFSAHVSPFHLLTTLGLGKGLVALAPVLPAYSIMFTDVKTFLAPNLINGAKLSRDVVGDRLRFHANLVVSLIVSVLVAITFTIYMTYLYGAQEMRIWFFSSAPRRIIDSASQFSIGEAMPFNASITTWYVIGAAWVALTMLIRRSVFWFPHPIGYLLLISPRMSGLWFSILIGWACKAVVVKYGGKRTFDRVLPLFIGLIVGEVLAMLIWTLAGLYWNFQVVLSLN